MDSDIYAIPQEAPRSPRRAIGISLLVLGAALILAGGGYLYYVKIYVPEQQHAKSTTFADQLQQVISAISAGQYARAIPQIAALYQQAVNESEKAQLKILLAESLSGRNQTGDMLQGSILLEQVSGDMTIPSRWRAEALNQIAILVGEHDLHFYQMYFSQPPFVTYVPSSGSDTARLQAAYLAILHASETQYPNTFAESALASSTGH